MIDCYNRIFHDTYLVCASNSKKDHRKCYERCTKGTPTKRIFYVPFHSKNDMFFSFIYRLLFYTCTQESVTIDFLSIKFVTCHAYFVY